MAIGGHLRQRAWSKMKRRRIPVDEDPIWQHWPRGSRHTRSVSPDGQRFEFVMVGDSDDARLFIELSSHAADLVEARDALELALRSMPDTESPLQDAERSLVANAAMAYCRTFFPSKVRRPVTDFVEIPQAFAATHEVVAMFRNRTIAHSQSDLSVTYAVGVCDAEALEVLDVTAPNISSTMPPEQVRSFIDLVNTVGEQLDEVIEPIRMRLMERLAVADRGALIKDGPRPAVRALWAAEFGSQTTRAPYPASHPVHLTQEVDS